MTVDKMTIDRMTYYQTKYVICNPDIFNLFGCNNAEEKLAIC
jgi:hypothetical protein